MPLFTETDNTAEPEEVIEGKIQERAIFSNHDVPNNLSVIVADNCKDDTKCAKTKIADKTTQKV